MGHLSYILGFFFLALSEGLFDTNETTNHGCIGPDSRAREEHHALTVETQHRVPCSPATDVMVPTFPAACK